MKLRVGVLMGGMSSEREVSFNSGRTICDHLDTTLYQIIPIFQSQQGTLYILPWHFLHRGKISDFEHRLAGEATRISWDILKDTIDFAYIALHGRFAEDGTLQGLLEILGIPYLGAKVFASAVRMDKSIQKNILARHGVAVPKSVTVYPHDIQHYEIQEQHIIAKLTEKNISFPCIVKPHKEGSSIGVAYVASTPALRDALLRACSVHTGIYQAVVVEEYIKGMEFSCVILKNYTTGEYLPLPATEIVPEAGTHIYDYEQKYMPGRGYKYTPARCTPEQMQTIQNTCIKAMRALEIDTMARIDGFLTTDNRVVIIDPNSLSGMGPSSFIFLQAAEKNMSHTTLINHLIKTELHAYGLLCSDEITAEALRGSMQAKKLLRVGVLMGGDSNEREISLESGRNVVYKLSPTTYEVLPIFVTPTMELYTMSQRLLVKNSTKEILAELDPTTRIPWSSLAQHVDFVFIALHGGKGENGCVQGALEMLKLPYNGSGVLASALCMDKYKTTQFLHQQGFDVPRSYLVHKKEWADESSTVDDILAQYNFPLIVKPHDDGCSVMVEKVTTKEALTSAIEAIFAHNKEHALVEEFVPGMELTVGVIGNNQPQALPPSQAVAASGILSITEKFLPGAGENQTPAPLPPEALKFVQDTMQNVFVATGCKGYARIDCFYQNSAQSSTGKERVVILEINSLPGLTPATCIFHQAAELGIKPMDFIAMIIELGLQEHRVEEQHNLPSSTNTYQEPSLSN